MKQNSPSSTARLIARSLILLSYDEVYSDFLNPLSVRIIKIFADANGKKRDILISYMKYSPFRRAVHFIESMILPGIFLHYAIRKKMICELAESAVRDHYRQMLILGAGFDALSFYMKEKYPGIACVEMDHPATQSVKSNAVSGLNGAERDVHFVPGDIRHLDGQQLRMAKMLDKNEPVLVIAEGLFMYFNSDEVKNAISVIRDAFSDRVRFIFTFLEPDHNGCGNFIRKSLPVRFWLAMKKERFAWGMRKTEITDFMTCLGFTAMNVIDPEESYEEMIGNRMRFRKKNQIGEYICVADKIRGGSYD